MSIVLFEPMLQSFTGHYNRYVRVISAEAARRGQSVRVASHVNVDAALKSALETLGVEVVPTFPDAPYFPGADSRTQTETAQRLFEAAWRSFQDKPSARVAWLSGTPTILRAAAMFAEKARIPFPFQLVDFSRDWAAAPRAAPDDLREILLGAERQGLRPFALTEFVANVASAEIGHPFRAFPPILEFKRPRAVRPRRNPHIGLMNIALQYKNLDSALPPLVRNAKQIAVSIHTGPYHSPQAANYIRQKMAVLSVLYGAEIGHIRVIDGVLDAVGYNKIWRSLDGVLLPYSVEKYSRQGSGIFIESLSDGIVPVAPLGTSMAAIAERLGVGLVYDADQPDSLAQAVETLIRDFKALSRKSIELAPKWRRENSPARVMSVLESVWETRD